MRKSRNIIWVNHFQFVEGEWERERDFISSFVYYIILLIGHPQTQVLFFYFYKEKKLFNKTSHEIWKAQSNWIKFFVCLWIFQWDFFLRTSCRFKVSHFITKIIFATSFIELRLLCLAPKCIFWYREIFSMIAAIANCLTTNRGEQQRDNKN